MTKYVDIPPALLSACQLDLASGERLRQTVCCGARFSSGLPTIVSTFVMHLSISCLLDSIHKPGIANGLSLRMESGIDLVKLAPSVPPSVCLSSAEG